MDGFSLFTETLAGMSSLRWPMRGLGIYGCGSLFPSFSLMRSNRRIKADIIGPNAQSGRFPAMSARPAHPTWSIIGIPAHGTRTENNTTTDNAPAPCPHGRQGSAISYALGTHSCRRFASSRGGTTKRSIYDRFM